MKCPRCGAIEFTTVRMYNEIGKTFKNVCANCGCVYPVIEGPKPKFHQRLWTYTKFLFGVGCFGGRTYVLKNYGMDIGSKPTFHKKDPTIKILKKPVEPHFSHRTPEEHDEAYIMDTAEGSDLDNLAENMGIKRQIPEEPKWEKLK